MFDVIVGWPSRPPPPPKKRTTEKRPNELASRDAAPLNPRLNRRNYLTS